MHRGIRIYVAAAAGLFVGSLAALPQAYTISAKPGVVNYIEGTAYLNGNKLSAQAVRSTFLAGGDSLSTDEGKAEVLLSPGVFLRIGDNSELRMISPLLTDTQVEVVRGEAILEAAGLLKDNQIQVTDHGASITIERNGLYRFRADNPASAAVLEGKAIVYFGENKLELGKGHETILGPSLKAQKFDPKQEDDLYAWSNVRSEYEAAASYQAAKAVPVNGNSGGFWWNYGYGGFFGPGWFWNSGFNCWAWLPAYGAFYSPFGWGFYAPGTVLYAPVVTTTVYNGGGWSGKPRNPNAPGRTWTGHSTTASVAIRTDHPPAVGVIAASPWATQQARVQAAQSLAATGRFNPGASGGSGAYVASSQISAPSGGVGVRGGGTSSGAGHSVSTSGGFSAGHMSSGGFSGMASGGGHSGGGGGAHH